MSAIGLLLGLLVLSYLGNVLRGTRVIQGFGLPSGAEYVLLGIVLGSHVLGVISQPLLDTFRPLLTVGASWVALVTALGYTRIGERPLRLGNALIGVLSTASIALAIGAAVWFTLPRLEPERGAERAWFAGAIAIVSSASTRQAVRWVILRYAAKGPLSDVLSDYARASAIVPVVGLSLLLAHAAPPGPIQLGFLSRAALTWGIGGLLGSVAVLLIGRGLRRDEIWGVIVGTSLLAMGVAEELGLSSVAACFSLGIALGSLSSHRGELVLMLRPTESAVLLPLAVLAGALVDVREAPLLAWLIPLGLGARVTSELLRGALLALCSRTARAAGPLVGLGLISMGDITLACAVSLALSFDTPAAQSVLAVAVLGVLAGELVGPGALRRALGRAAELHADPEPRPSIEPRGNEA